MATTKQHRAKQRKQGLQLDPHHEGLDIFSQDITLDIWAEKYRYGGEEHPYDSMRRVVEGVYAHDPDEDAKWLALEAMKKALWVPGGRIQSTAGTPKITTMINCFVDRTIEDSMDGIGDALKDAMLTMQQGGGIGMDFSTLRPSGAHLQRTGAVASGPLPFMEMWDAMCATIMSAGSRRGAMMGTMHCEHPDILKFVEAKHKAGVLTNFNVSVLVTDAFIAAVEEDEDWYLGFNVPRADGKHYFVTDRDDLPWEGTWYAYSKIPARELWDKILQSTYEYSEPGVIFIDRINDTNNLDYCETIHCTNPCGEQPLPPNGACNLGAVNLARMVKDPFLPSAKFDYELLQKVAGIGTRFLDNVIDTTIYPLETQREEEINKRRIGLGITGLANALAMLGHPYGDPLSIEVTSKIMSTLQNAVYATSAMLAKERGSFRLYDKKQWGKNSVCYKNLQPAVKAKISRYGIRNGVLLTIAPTGTTSIYMGNVSSGLEPVFLRTLQRRVRQADGSFKIYIAKDYGAMLADGMDIESKHIIDHTQVTVDQHLRIQACCQEFIDASVSKTINIPKDLPFEDFKEVYTKAYAWGCKGCTTYRPSDVRGSILSAVDEAPGNAPIDVHAPAERPVVISGRTYKARWPHDNASYYITINELNGKPFEMFISSNSSKYSDWTTALSLTISAIMRLGVDISFIPDELRKVQSFTDGAWIKQRYYGSLVALIGETLGEHLDRDDICESNEAIIEEVQDTQTQQKGEQCPQCGLPTLTKLEGCLRCTNCDFNLCG